MMVPLNLSIREVWLLAASLNETNDMTRTELENGHLAGTQGTLEETEERIEAESRLEYSTALEEALLDELSDLTLMHSEHSKASPNLTCPACVGWETALDAIEGEEVLQ